MGGQEQGRPQAQASWDPRRTLAFLCLLHRETCVTGKAEEGAGEWAGESFVFPVTRVTEVRGLGGYLPYADAIRSAGVTAGASPSAPCLCSGPALLVTHVHSLPSGLLPLFLFILPRDLLQLDPACPSLHLASSGPRPLLPRPWPPPTALLPAVPSSPSEHSV